MRAMAHFLDRCDAGHRLDAALTEVNEILKMLMLEQDETQTSGLVVPRVPRPSVRKRNVFGSRSSNCLAIFPRSREGRSTSISTPRIAFRRSSGTSRRI